MALLGSRSHAVDLEWSRFTDGRGVRAMTWEAPTFIELRMDAEINSYQDDFDREQDDRF